MPTKPKEKVLPLKPQVRFYVSEDIRQEVNGKVSAIGLYPDNVILLQLPDDVPDPTESQPILIQALGFLFNVSKLSQATTISIDIKTNGKRKPFAQPKEYPSPGPGRSINILGLMQPVLIASFGEKTLYVKVGESVYTFNYEIRRASLPKTSDAPRQKSEMSEIRKISSTNKKQPRQRDAAREGKK